jgi:carbamoyl-phosphate synthase large subunit
MDEVSVLISSAGRRVGLLEAFRESLTALGVRGSVLAADASPLSAAFHVADRAFEVPPCTTEDFVPAIQRLCREEGVRLVVPTIDPELPAYARHRDAFERTGTTVAVSALEVIDIARDKVRTHAWLRGHGFPTVDQASPEEVLADGWPFPLMVKPRAGSAAAGVAVVGDRSHLEVATRAGDFVVQTIAPGAEYSVDVLVDRDGRARCAVPRRRIEVRAGEVSKGVTERCAPVVEVATRLAEALPGARGALTVQAFFDSSDGQVRVIEINPRFGGGFPLSRRAGADFPRWMLEEISGHPSTVSDGWRKGLVMLRYDEAVFVDRSEVGL